jgi:hypothetical protein
MRALLASLAALIASLLSQPAVAQERYAVGQVWEYTNRPQDGGSLIKIQRIEELPGLGTVYHISMIGVRIGGEPQAAGHLPVSRKTLDASVIRLSGSAAEFPDASEGIAEWRKAKGGVFTITLAEIADVLEKAITARRE